MYRILIVEDDAVIAAMLADQLAKWGFDTDYVVDFSDVVGKFQQYQPQLVLLDISLPFYNGYFGAEKSVKFLRCRLYFYPLIVKIWTW